MPVMTYGAHLWWHPKWKGQKWIIKELLSTQYRAARWITGAFRTTPVGALEIAAGLMPIKNSINQLMHKAAYRVHTLHRGHPIRAHLPDK